MVAQEATNSLESTIPADLPKFCEQQITLQEESKGSHNVPLEKLYGRNREEARLFEAYARILGSVQDRASELILISGPSGTGKTALAQRLREPAFKDNGYFISGKFDQLQRPEPYTALVSAFSELIDLISREGPKRVSQVRKSILEKMDGDEQILIDMIPGLVNIVGDQRMENLEMRGSEYINRFKMVFQKFARAVCLRNRPIVLLIDDLQWADVGSLDLIESIVTDVGNKGLVFVGSCRDNVSLDSDLSQKLRWLEDSSVVLTNISLSNLSEGTIAEMLTEIYEMDEGTTKSLTEAMFSKSGGNPFFLSHMMRHMTTKGLLYIEDGEWKLKEGTLQLIRSGGRPSDIVEMIEAKLLQLDSTLQHTMKVAACIGATFEAKIIEHACPNVSVTDSLKLAMEAGMLVFDEKLRTFKFAHDKFQQAAFNLIAQEKRDAFHLRVGKNLWKSLRDEDLEKNIFIVLNQLNRGSLSLENNTERYGVASLCLTAGKKAIKSSGFRTATDYLEKGISLLGERGWIDEYQLSLDLHNSAAEAQFVVANFDRMEALIETVLQNARTYKDKLRVYATQVYSLGARNYRNLAMDKGLRVLEHLGESFPSSPRSAYIKKETVKTKLLLRNKTDESIIRLPLMDKPEKVAAMQMLNLLFLNSYIVRPDYLSPILLRMVQLTLRCGVCAISSVGFAGYGAVLCGVMGDFRGGERFGTLAMSLLYKFKAKEWTPRVYAALYGCISHWRKPLSLSVEPLMYGHTVGLETGDIEFSLLLLNIYCYYRFHYNARLEELEQKLRLCCELCKQYKQESCTLMSQSYLQFILNLMGKSEDKFLMRGEAFDETTGLKLFKESNDAYSYTSLHFQKMFLAYMFGNCELALEMAYGCGDAESSALGSFMVVLVVEFASLAALSLAQRRHHLRRNLRIGRRGLQKLKKWARCEPNNFLDKLCLVQAEYAVAVGNHNRAHAKFLNAVALSGEQGFTYQYALSNERTGRYLLQRGNDIAMRKHLNTAYQTYLDWGSVAKAKQLQEEFTFLQPPLETS